MLGLPGVGPTTAARLSAVGLARLEQLALYAPRRYDDAGALRPIASVAAGERVYLEGAVVRASIRRFFRRATLEVTLADDSGKILLRWFRFRGEIPDRFATGRRVRAAGLVRAGKRGLELAQPIAEAVDQATRLDGATALRPRYAPIEGVPGARVEKLCALAAEASLPDSPFAPASLPSLSSAVRAVHLRPPPTAPGERAALLAGASPAHQRLAFEELLLLRLRARQADKGRAASLSFDAERVLSRFFSSLSLRPTGAQRREIVAVAAELGADTPMRRLLTGDVGSGKTLCAAAAFELCAAAGARGAFLLPTLLLAEQQAATLSALFAPLGRQVVLVTGATPRAERRRLCAALADRASPIDVVVGTHALLDEALPIAGLALVVVDEQQRFGVAARAALVDKARGAGTTPHQLALSATPIPRTLALALRGALSLGHLDELPPGRAPIATRLFAELDAIPQALDEARAAIEDGGQVYWVCPQIEAGAGRGAIEAAAWLGEQLGSPVELCHGAMKPAERRRALATFRAGAKVLCATTIVEVGIDVPSATLMVIEGPERLGLAALHQLRGRVGRGRRPGACILCAPGAGKAERARLAPLLTLSDGLQIAEADLARRGMGDLGGVAQSGLPALPPLPPGMLTTLLDEAEATAQRISERDPELADPAHARLRRALGHEDPRLGRRFSYDSA